MHLRHRAQTSGPGQDPWRATAHRCRERRKASAAAKTSSTGGSARSVLSLPPEREHESRRAKDGAVQSARSRPLLHDRHCAPASGEPDHHPGGRSRGVQRTSAGPTRARTSVGPQRAQCALRSRPSPHYLARRSISFVSRHQCCRSPCPHRPQRPLMRRIRSGRLCRTCPN